MVKPELIAFTALILLSLLVMSLPVALHSDMKTAIKMFYYYF